MGRFVSCFFFSGKDRLGILVQKMVLVSHTCYLFFLLPSLSFSLSVVSSVLIKMSPNNFIYMIVACFSVCVCVYVLLSLMDLFQPLFRGRGPRGMPRWTRTWISIYFQFISSGLLSSQHISFRWLATDKGVIFCDSIEGYDT